MTLNQLKEKAGREFDKLKQEHMMGSFISDAEEDFCEEVKTFLDTQISLTYQTALKDVLKVMPKKLDCWENLDRGIAWDVSTGMVREGINQAIDTITKAIKKLNKHF